MKLPAPLSCGIFVGENKCLLHGGEDEAGENIPFSAPVGSPGETKCTPWFPGVGIPFQGGFLLLWSVVAGTFPLASKIAMTSI